MALYPSQEWCDKWKDALEIIMQSPNQSKKPMGGYDLLLVSGLRGKALWKRSPSVTVKLSLNMSRIAV